MTQSHYEAALQDWEELHINFACVVHIAKYICMNYNKVTSTQTTWGIRGPWVLGLGAVTRFAWLVIEPKQNILENMSSKLQTF